MKLVNSSLFFLVDRVCALKPLAPLTFIVAEKVDVYEIKTISILQLFWLQSGLFELSGKVLYSIFGLATDFNNEATNAVLTTL